MRLDLILWPLIAAADTAVGPPFKGRPVVGTKPASKCHKMKSGVLAGTA